MKNRPFLMLCSLGLSAALCFFSGPVLYAETVSASAKNTSAVLPPQTGPAPLTLEDCYHLALDQSETVAIQREAIERAKAQILTAASLALPEVDFVSTREFQQAPKNANTLAGSFIEKDQHERKFTISQPLFQGFKAVGAIGGSRSFKRQQQETWIRSKELLYTDVAHAFYSVLQYQKGLSIIRDVHGLLEQRIKELEEREKIGRSRLSEIATAQTALRTLEADLAGAKGLLATSQYLLEFLIGMTLENRMLQDDRTESPAVRPLADCLKTAQNRSDVQAAEQAVQTATRGIWVAQSGFWPTISLDHTQYTHRENFLANVDWDLLFTVNVPLFSGGATIGQVKDAVGALKQQKFSFSLAKRTADMEVKQSYDGWRFSREQYLALKEAVAAAEEDYRLQSDEYRRSLVNNLDVLSALQSLQSTRQSENVAFYQMKQDEAQLKVAIGEVL